MLTMEKTADYVKRWVAAFESKDLDRVLAFYTNDVIFHSPLVARLSHDPSGTVQGKAALRAYVKKGFEVFDHIKFTVLDVLRGVDSIAIHYMGITGTHVVEVLFFDKDGVVRESYVHYSSLKCIDVPVAQRSASSWSRLRGPAAWRSESVAPASV
jgi:ketosteroid isomerase-like protein